MQSTTLSHSRAVGWSSPLPRELDSPTTLVLAFGAPSYAEDPPGHDGPFGQLRAAFPRSHIVGCSTAGEIHGTSIRDESLAIAIARFERTPLRTAFEPVCRETSFETAVRLGRSLAGEALRGVFVLTDGQDVNGSRFVEGLRSVLGDVPISGGLAGDGTRFKETWVVADGAPRRGAACAVGLYGNAIQLGHGSKGGWDKFGPERRITRARENVLYELDGRPALDLYKTYLGELASGMPATALLFPLAIRLSREGAEQVVRTVLAYSDESKSLTFAGDMPEGAFAQLMRANFDRLVDAASHATVAAVRAPGAGAAIPSLCIAVSCVGRRLVLGERAEEETEAVAELLPGCAVTGFYAYGEISPNGLGDCGLHNQTMTLTTLAER